MCKMTPIGVRLNLKSFIFISFGFRELFILEGTTELAKSLVFLTSQGPILVLNYLFCISCSMEKDSACMAPKIGILMQQPHSFFCYN